jgi:hypothetical protein
MRRLQDHGNGQVDDDVVLLVLDLEAVLARLPDLAALHPEAAADDSQYVRDVSPHRMGPRRISGH